MCQALTGSGHLILGTLFPLRLRAIAVKRKKRAAIPFFGTAAQGLYAADFVPPGETQGEGLNLVVLMLCHAKVLHVFELVLERFHLLLKLTTPFGLYLFLLF